MSAPAAAYSLRFAVRRTSQPLIASALLCQIIAPVHAQEAVEPSSTQTMRKLTVSAEVESETSYTAEDSAAATRLPLTLRETPQSITVFTRERIEDQKLESVRDVLDSTPGIYSYQYDTERVLFSSRGFIVDNLMYDGVPATTNFSTDSIDETLDSALYERVEIVRGATGLTTGAGNPAASVNLVRKRADSKKLAGTLALSGGSWENGRVEADASTALNADGTVRARAVGVHQDRDSYQDLYRNKRTVFYGALEADLSPNTLLSLSFDYQNNDPTGNTWGSFPLYLADGSRADWDRSVTTATDWASWNRRTKSVVAEMQHVFDNDWIVRGSLTWRRFNETATLFYMDGFPDPQDGTGLEPFAYRSKAQITDKMLDLYASGAVDLFGRQHELVLGFNGSRSDNVGREFANDELPLPGNFFDWDGSYPEPTFDAQGVLLNDIDSRQNGLYVAGRFVLADPLKLIGGLRYATWKTEHFYLYDSPDITYRDEYNEIIPYAGLIYDITSGYSLFASYTQIFKPQNARDVNGAYLDPIEGESLELGIKGEHFDGRLNTALTLFETKQDNLAAALVDPQTGEPMLLPDGTQASHPIDGARSRGFELEVAGELREGWNASLGWSRYQIEDAEGEDVRTFVPRTLLRAFTTWTPTRVQALSIGGGISWQSDSYTTVGAPDGAATFEQKALTLLSLMLRYAITPQLTMQFNAENLLDEKYYVLDEFDNTYFGEPQKYTAAVSWSF